MLSTMSAPASPSPAELGAVVQRLRLQQGLSLHDFAQRSGLLPADVEQLEAGASEFDLQELLAIGRGLGMEVSTIFRVWEASNSAGLTAGLDGAPHGSTPP